MYYNIMLWNDNTNHTVSEEKKKNRPSMLAVNKPLTQT